MATVEKPLGGLQCQHVRQSGVRGQIGGGNNEARLMMLHTGDHGRLGLDGLGSENKAQSAFLRQAMARVSLDTDCMMAETSGTFREMAGFLESLPIAGQGVFRHTRSGMQSSEV